MPYYEGKTFREDIFSRGHVLSKKCPLEFLFDEFEVPGLFHSVFSLLLHLNMIFCNYKQQKASVWCRRRQVFEKKSKKTIRGDMSPRISCHLGLGFGEFEVPGLPQSFLSLLLHFNRFKVMHKRLCRAW